MKKELKRKIGIAMEGNPISKAELDQKAWDRAYERFLEDTKHRLGYAIGYQDGWNEAIEYINPKKK